MRTCSILFGLAFGFVSSLLCAEPWFRFGENRLEDRYIDEDFDAEDMLAPRIDPRKMGRRPPWWVSLTFYTEERASLQREWGGAIVLALPFEAAPMVWGGSSESMRPTLVPVADILRSPPLPISSDVVRKAVQIAWSVASLSVDDPRLESLANRARISSLLPETRLRAMRTQDVQARIDSLPDEQRYYDRSGANLWLEARLTWRLDRIVYADDEVSIERIRIEHHEARTKLAGRVIENMAKWQRAWIHRQSLASGSDEALEAEIHQAEAEMVLDQLTDGWFSRWRESISSVPTQPSNGRTKSF